ncbi:MAG: fluoride efflux transporter CrcB [Gemmatimonadetes bacterium]|nr:fluoride efflux transporter CrcB [Gemmatimonadota bacterium]
MTSPLTVGALLAVALGGALGSVLRYVLGVVVPPVGGLPAGTLVVNVVGSFLVGLFVRLFVTPDADHVLRLALTAGLCGGFTTFSTFSAETVTLLQQGRAGRALLYVALSLLLGLAAAAAGLATGARVGAR